MIQDGCYRIKSVSTNTSRVYLTHTPNGQVRGAQRLAPDSDTQKWKITRKFNGHYEIFSMSAGSASSIAEPNGFEKEITMSITGSATEWIFSVRTNGDVLNQDSARIPSPKNTLDLSAGDRIVLWLKNELPQQWWTFELIQPLPRPTTQASSSSKDTKEVIIDDGHKDIDSDALGSNNDSDDSDDDFVDVETDDGSTVFVDAPKLEWIACAGSEIPPYAVKGGHEKDGMPLYIARAAYKGGIHPGKAGPHLTPGCRIPCGGEEHKIESYEVLTGDPSLYRWVSYNRGTLDGSTLGAIPIEGCREKNGTPLYHIRAYHNGSMVPGKAGPGLQGRCNVGYHGKEWKITEAYSVLCYP